MALTKTYTIEVEGQKAQATVGQIKQEIERLEAVVEKAQIGTKELDEAMLQLGRAKGALKELDDAVDALDPKAQAGAYLDFANGVTGAWGIATVAAENFGLASAGSAEKVQEKMLQLLTVMQAFEAIQKATNSETQASMKNLLSYSSNSIKSVLGLGNGWTLAGVKAKLFGTATRAALTSTGIGIFIVLLGTVIANWDSISGAVGRFGDKMKNVFPGLFEFVDTLTSKLRDAASFLTGGLIDNSVTAAIKQADEADAKATEARIARRKNLIAEEQSAGRSVYKLKQEQMVDELRLLDLQGKKETQEYRDKYSEIIQLKASHDLSLKQRDEKAWAEALEREKRASEESYRLAEEAYNKRRQLEAQAQQEEIAADEEARKRKYELAKFDGASQQQLLRIEIENLASVQADLISQGKRFGSEFLAVQNEIAEKERAIAAANLEDFKKAREEKQRLQQEELARMQEASDIAVINLKLQGATEREVAEATIRGMEEQLAYMEKAGLARTKAFAELKLQVKELKEGLVPANNDLMSKLLMGIFKVKPKDLEKVKASLEQSMQVIYSSVGYLSDTLVSDALLKLDSYMAYLDEQLSLSQERQSAAEQGMQESLQRRQELEGELEDARGARREYLLQQIAKERMEESRLAAEKKKAAAEEAKIAKQKEAIELKRQELEAKGRLAQEAGIAISQAAAAYDAVAAAVASIRAGSSVPFPGNLVAIAAGVAAVAAAVVSAKKLAATVKQAKFRDGGSPNEVSGEVKGPSHAQGGVPFTVKGVGGYEMEGDEFIVRKTAYANNRETIRKINAIGNSVRFVAIPEHQVQRRAAGGEAATGAGAASNTVAVAGDTTPVNNADLAAIRELLQSIDANTLQAANNKPGYIGPWESRKIVEQARGLERDEGVGKLF